jgi:hypothetical protein
MSRISRRRLALGLSLLAAPLAAVLPGCASDGDSGEAVQMRAEPRIILTESMPIFSVPTIGYGETLDLRVGLNAPNTGVSPFTVTAQLIDHATGATVPTGDIFATYDSVNGMPDLDINVGADVGMYEQFKVKAKTDINSAYHGDLIKVNYTIQNSMSQGTSGMFYVYLPR